MSWVDSIKAWFVARWLKRPPEPIRPKREAMERPDLNYPLFIDRFEQRRSDPEFAAIDFKVREALSILKGKGLL